MYNFETFSCVDVGKQKKNNDSELPGCNKRQQ